MYELPTEIKVKDKSWTIRNRGDFRVVLDCFTALNDIELSKQERIIACLAIFLEDVTCIEDVYKIPDLEEVCKQMMLFFNCGQEESGRKLSYRLIDWKRDESLICSAINNVANKEIRLEPYIHWWTFMGYYMAVGESSLATVVSIRSKQSKNKKLEKHEKQFIAENPQYFNWDRRTIEAIDEENLIMSMWNQE